MDITKRCGICNAVSSPALIDETSRFSGGKFHSDPSDELHFICDDCAVEYYTVRADYQKQELEEGEVEYSILEDDDPITIETILYSEDYSDDES